jgi:AcrR family transcriptional regulator
VGRPRQFDEDLALEAAMDAFWATGYEATSTRDLCRATGLGRSSIYNTFASKEQLFRRALARYADRMTGRQIEALDAAGSALEVVRQLLDSVIGNELDDGADPRGCLVVNTLVELADKDAEVARTLADDYRRRFVALREALARGQREGEVDQVPDAATLAHFVIASLSGIRVSARAGVDRAALRAIAATVLDTVRADPPTRSTPGT